MKKHLKNMNNYTKLLLIIGAILLLIGSVFVVFSLKKETLDDKYKIDKYTTYSSVSKSLNNGEINVTKDIIYVTGGVYKVIYKVHSNSTNINSLLKENSSFIITDVLGDSYELLKNKVKINNLSIDVSDSKNIDTKSLKVTYYNNIIDISIPSSSINNSFVIETYIKLKNRETNKKHVTTKEAYYSFIPNIQNDNYLKKSIQSYVIDGSAYIVLIKK